MTLSDDRRVWSITPRGLSEFVDGLLNQAGMPSAPALYLQRMLKAGDFYPARNAEMLCSPLPPNAFLTYHSSQNFVDLQELVWSASDFAGQLLVERRPELAGQDLKSFVADGIRFWIDFVFIDQSARDIRAELDVLPHLLRQVDAHFVVGSAPLRRAWCCYEIALFNERSGNAADALSTTALRSFIAPTTTLYFDWDATDCTEPEDKLFIEERISRDFPDGFHGFTGIMQEANATAVLSATGDTAYPSAALESLGEAAERWWDDWVGGE